MATATTNILINSISGRIGNVVFYTRPGARRGGRIQCVRGYVIPRNPDTQAQRTVRRSFADAVRSWQSMSPDEQYAYARKARYLNMSGYNLYISKYMKRITQSLDLASIDEQKSKFQSFPWNLELSTCNFLPIHSVSKSHLLLPGSNPPPYSYESGPG